MSELFATPCTVTHQAPLSLGKNTRVDCHALLQRRYLSDSGIEPASLASPAFVGRFFTTGASWEALNNFFSTFFK